MFNEIKEMIVQNLDIDPKLIKEETNLRNDLDINSFELVNLICLFEDKYDLDFNERDIRDIKTIKDAENLIKKYQAKKN